MTRSRRHSLAAVLTEAEPASEDTLALSFLDVLSCGLGAGICLFLIFSVMPHIGRTGSGTSVPTTVTGADLMARNIGAKFEDWDDVVYNAPILIVVRLEYSEKSLPDPPPKILADQIRLRGLPSNALQSLPKGLAAPQLCEWYITLPQGLRPPHQIISGFIREGRQLEGYKCTVEVAVGGSKRQVKSLDFPEDGEGERKLFDLNLTTTDWIVPTATHRSD